MRHLPERSRLTLEPALNGEDASTIDIDAFRQFYSQALRMSAQSLLPQMSLINRKADGTFDNYNIFTKNHASRWQKSVSTNPCVSVHSLLPLSIFLGSPSLLSKFFNAPFAGVIAAPGGHAFAYRMFSNHTPEKPDGTLTKETFASFFSANVNKDGSIAGKGLGHEQIPNNW